jgi:NAD(P)-dependent dehydrogenase (short-subunit alcohol dehydrogenase family)
VATNREVLAADALAGKRVLITGGGTGIGLAMAHHLVAHGATVHLWGRRQGVLDDAVAGLDAVRPGRASSDAVDVRHADQVQAAVARAWSEHGAVTGLLNNAAANFIAPTEKLSARAFQAVTDTVMLGAFNATVACGTRWIDTGRPGSVVSMLTTWVWSGSAFVVPAAMAKTAVHAMTMSLAVEWARYNIRLNAVAAGPFPTEYAWQMLNPTRSSGVGATQSGTIPAGRFGDMAELGNLVGFLLSDGCDYLTGATVPIDGGQRLAGPSTFAGLSSLSAVDWAQARQASQDASAASRAQRTV